MTGLEGFIKELFQSNFSELFPNFVLLTEQNEYIIKYGEQKGRKLDDLAFHKIKKTFCIFEYKSESDREHINQGLTYLNALQEPANRYHLKELWRKHSGLDWELDEFNWEEMEIVCISPKFTEYQRGAERKQINLIHITQYKNKTIRLETKYPELLAGDRSDKFEDEEVNIENLCQELNTNERTKEKLLKIDNLVSPYIAKKKVIWQNWVDYQQEEKSCLLICIEKGDRKRKFRVYLEDNEITKYLEYHEHNWSINLHRWIACETEEDYQKISNLLIDYLKHLKNIN